MDQATLGLSREYLTKGFEDKIVQAYYQYQVDIAVLLGADKARAEKELKESLQFEMKLANVSYKHYLSFCKKKRQESRFFIITTQEKLLTENYRLPTWQLEYKMAVVATLQNVCLFLDFFTKWAKKKCEQTF